LNILVYLLQLIARGTCIDGTACPGIGPCGSWGGTGVGPDKAWVSAYYSSAIAAFSTAGTTTVLIRVNNPNGCGAGGARCLRGGGVQYKVGTREHC